jgi:hypothetical protein
MLMLIIFLAVVLLVVMVVFVLVLVLVVMVVGGVGVLLACMLLLVVLGAIGLHFLHRLLHVAVVVVDSSSSSRYLLVEAHLRCLWPRLMMAMRREEKSEMLLLLRGWRESGRTHVQVAGLALDDLDHVHGFVLGEIGLTQPWESINDVRVDVTLLAASAARACLTCPPAAVTLSARIITEP